MMYATLNEFKHRIGDAFESLYPDESVADEDLADAQAEIDGCLAVRYEIPCVPEGSAAALLRSWTLTLAEERASARSASARLDEKLKYRADLVRARLDEIRQDLFRLPDLIERQGGDAVFLETDDPVFTRETMKRF